MRNKTKTKTTAKITPFRIQAVTRRLYIRSRWAVAASAMFFLVALILSTTQGAHTSALPQKSSACTVHPQHKKIKDLNPDDKLEPWKRNGASQIVINFEMGKLTAEYQAYVQNAAKVWSKSVCITARAVKKCPTKGNCVKVVYKKSGGDGAVGTFSDESVGGYTVRGMIELFDDALRPSDKGMRRNTLLHEMGHASGLRHRQTGGKLMSTSGHGGTLLPDQTDWRNLRVLYGKQR